MPTFFPNASLTITRFAGDGAYDNDGHWIDGTPGTFTIETSWQPIRGEELEALAEGRRIDRAYKGFSDVLLFTVNQNTGQPPDVVSFEGENYPIIHREVWQNGLINHYMFVAMRQKEQESV